jgi:hypothetical protein
VHNMAKIHRYGPGYAWEANRRQKAE